MVRCLLVDSGLPSNLWGELMLTTTYLCNRVPHSALEMETPYKVLYGKEADLSHLKIIGSRAFVHIKDSTKLGHTSWEGMVCGFSENESNSYRVWNPKTRRITLSAEYAYAATNLQESCLRGGEKERIPNTFKEAISLPKAAYWKEAADNEIQSLEKHGVYELVPMSFVPSSQNVVGTRWVNKIKADGTFKSRLVVQGWSQVPGIDYGGTFAPT
ncbi:unnamed protein product [Ascophyllum nodosum]